MSTFETIFCTFAIGVALALSAAVWVTATVKPSEDDTPSRLHLVGAPTSHRAPVRPRRHLAPVRYLEDTGVFPAVTPSFPGGDAA